MGSKGMSNTSLFTKDVANIVNSIMHVFVHIHV
ncbi:MAG: hypothetical protein Sylvanvirus4_28 [Sylvanvirus sp.]|uniref:Uncharacterized protein n=1 Tax=Sylvanvirus sp. TaxID=2487774 RepID=A0A3G5AJ45_9VIRU|nr:MAG: hypothetical protein Sylvanvirus4_28 [Sylvanvirus sp.]